MRSWHLFSSEIDISRNGILRTWYKCQNRVKICLESSALRSVHFQSSTLFHCSNQSDTIGEGCCSVMSRHHPLQDKACLFLALSLNLTSHLPLFLLFEGENRNGSCEKYHDSKWFTKSNTKGKEDTTYFNRSCDISERLAEIHVRIFRVVERQLREEDNRHCYGNEPGVEPH